MLKKIITLIVLLLIIGGIVAITKNNRPVEVQNNPPQTKLPADSTPVGAPSAIEQTNWVWVETIANNDTSITPKKAGAFSIMLTDGKVTGKTDCNSFFSSYQIGSDGVISFGPIGSTKMACEGSQEAVFTDFISKTTRYTLDANGNLVLLLAQDSGSVMFKKGNPSGDITLGVGEKKTVGDLTVTFNKFVQDSRCAIDVVCIQAGAVNVNVTLADSTHAETKNFPSDEAPQTFGEYKVSITNIEPARQSTKVIPEKDYKITFHIE